MHAPPEIVLLAERIGWAIVHSLWLGAAAAALVLVLLRLLPSRLAAVRHLACVGALLALPIATVVVARPSGAPPSRLPVQQAPAAAPQAAPRAEMTFAEPEPPRADLPRERRLEDPPAVSWSALLSPWVPWLAPAWAFGVFLLTISYGAGWLRIRALRRTGRPAPADAESAFARLLAAFGISRETRLLISETASAPMLAGFFKPVVLLPGRVLLGLGAAELEAILAHELAHLARRDHWFNLAQLVCETLFFYHPAVWWIGHCARSEREHAADDLAVRVCRDRKVYASALASMGELELAPTVALAANTGSLLTRVRRIVGAPEPRSAAAPFASGAIAAVITAAAVVCGYAANEKVIEVAPGQSIQEAIDAAPEGATIRLGAGEYRERIVITKPLTLEGAGWEKTRIAVEEPSSADQPALMADVRARRASANSAEARIALANEWAEKAERPAIYVRQTERVTIRKLRVQGKSNRGPRSGSGAATLIYFLRAKATINDCAIVGPYRDGITLRADSEVEIKGSFVGALWGEGVQVEGKGDFTGPSRLQLRDSEMRNVYHYGIVLGPGCDTSIVERCRISGTAWHGIRYDSASPTITGNIIFRNARFGIYASGTTAAKVRGNVLWRNEMEGMWCLSGNADTVEGNTFVANSRGGLAVSGAKPKLTRNIFADVPVGVACGRVGSRSGGASEPGEPEFAANLFHRCAVALKVDAQDKPAPEGSLTEDPQFRGPEDFALAADSPAARAKIGAATPLAPAGPWPLLDEEKSIIPVDDTRSFEYWSAPGAAKPRKAAAPQR